MSIEVFLIIIGITALFIIIFIIIMRFFDYKEDKIKWTYKSSQNMTPEIEKEIIELLNEQSELMKEIRKSLEL